MSGTVTGVLAAVDSNQVRIVGYVLVAGLSVSARGRERQRAANDDGVWPPFWWLTAAFLLSLAIARAGDIAEVITGLGRARASDEGWYQARRPIQAAVVGSVGVVWFVSVAAACWRIPERRRRYLPMGIVVVTIAAFVAIRLVSLHQVDALLYNRELASIRVATLIECVLVGVAAGVSWWVPTGRTVVDEGSTRSDSPVPRERRGGLDRSDTLARDRR